VVVLSRARTEDVKSALSNNRVNIKVVSPSRSLPGSKQDNNSIWRVQDNAGGHAVSSGLSVQNTVGRTSDIALYPGLPIYTGVYSRLDLPTVS
jgi:hypothetical protein